MPKIEVDEATADQIAAKADAAEAGPKAADAEPTKLGKDQHALFIHAAPKRSKEPTDEHSEEFRKVRGHTPRTAKEGLKAALKGGAAHPIPFAQASAERRNAEAADRAERTVGHAHTAAEVADKIAPNNEPQAGALLAHADRYGSVTLVESRQDARIQYSVQQNVSDHPVLVEVSDDPDAPKAHCAPGSFIGTAADGSRVVISAETLYQEYRPAHYGPRGRIL